jgi:hypothetical protein
VRILLRPAKHPSVHLTKPIFRRPIGIASPGEALAATDGCPDSTAEIATDRPDITNSSLVVPMGSLQSENGVNISALATELSLSVAQTAGCAWASRIASSY